MVMTEPVKENREECVVVEKRSVVGTEDEDESQGNGSGGSQPILSGKLSQPLLALGARREKQLMHAVETRYALSQRGHHSG